MQGQWQGQWGGSWQGNAGEGSNPVVLAGLSAQGASYATLSPKALIRAALIASGEATGALAGQLQYVVIPSNPGGSGLGYGFIADKPRKKRDDEYVLLMLM